jgi:hypothetical protein
MSSPPERDLARLLAGLRPRGADAPYVFARAPADAPAALAALPAPPFATVREAEGVTWVLPRADADAAGLDYAFVAGRITLEVASALDAIGLTAAVAGRLAEAGIACNVIAGSHHDHLFVPVADVERALELLRRLSAEAPTD